MLIKDAHHRVINESKSYGDIRGIIVKGKFCLYPDPLFRGELFNASF